VLPQEDCYRTLLRHSNKNTDVRVPLLVSRSRDGQAGRQRLWDVAGPAAPEEAFKPGWAAALERAAQVCDGLALEWNSDRLITEQNYAGEAAKRIRKLAAPVERGEKQR
jgi:hypothetical protein